MEHRLFPFGVYPAISVQRHAMRRYGNRHYRGGSQAGGALAMGFAVVSKIKLDGAKFAARKIKEVRP